MLKQLTHVNDDVTVAEFPYGVDAAFRDPSGNHIRIVRAP